MKYIKYLRFLLIPICSLIIFSPGGIAQKNKKSDDKKIAVQKHGRFAALCFRGSNRNTT